MASQSSSWRITAHEQMIIARVILYDRLYYHHKVRAAEAYARMLSGDVQFRACLTNLV